MTLLYAIAPPIHPIESSIHQFETFITRDNITCKALDRARRCIEEGSEVVWIEGESGTGKSLLAGLMAQEQEQHSSTLFNICHYSLCDVLMKRVSRHGSQALCIHIPASVTLRDIRTFQCQMNAYTHFYREHIHFLCFMSLPAYCYHPVVARQINLMKQTYIRQHYEYMMLRPLKHRPQDIGAISQDIFKKLSFLYEGTIPNALHSFTSYSAKLASLHFENNVWGLQHACLYLLQHGDIELSQDYLMQVRSTEAQSGKDSSLSLINAEGQLKSFEDLEKQIYQFACEHQGSKSAAARALGIGRTTLYRKSTY